MTIHHFFKVIQQNKISLLLFLNSGPWTLTLKFDWRQTVRPWVTFLPTFKLTLVGFEVWKELQTQTFQCQIWPLTSASNFDFKIHSNMILDKILYTGFIFEGLMQIFFLDSERQQKVRFSLIWFITAYLKFLMETHIQTIGHLPTNFDHHRLCSLEGNANYWNRNFFCTYTETPTHTGICHTHLNTVWPPNKFSMKMNLDGKECCREKI